MKNWTFSHTECILSAAPRYWRFYQHHNDNRIGVNNRRNYPNVDTLLETLGNNSLWSGRVGKLFHSLARITRPSVKLTSWIVPRSSILSEKTSFPASFATLADRKNIYTKTKLPLPSHPQLHSLNREFGVEREENAVFCTNLHNFLWYL